MSVATVHTCDSCFRSSRAAGRISLPKGWTVERGYSGDRRLRPVRHYCCKCSAKRARARNTLHKEQL